MAIPTLVLFLGAAALLFFALFVTFAILYAGMRGVQVGGTVDKNGMLPTVIIPRVAVDGEKTATAHPFVRIVHMVQIPWEGSNKTLKLDMHDFDHSWYHKAKAAIPANWEVQLWTYDDIHKMVLERYSQELWDYIWRRVTRPVQAVDFFRLLVVYEYGGAALQFKSDLLDPENLDNFFTPSEGKTAKVFLDHTMSEHDCREVAKREVIRQGIPEHQDRVLFGVFSGCKHAGFLRFAIQRSLRNLALHNAVTDYDVLYIGGNDMITQAYHDYVASGGGDLEMVGREEFNRSIQVHSTGSWRMDTLSL
jgi:hypothetical protein